jgi:hypothetical protein
MAAPVEARLPTSSTQQAARVKTVGKTLSERPPARGAATASRRSSARNHPALAECLALRGILRAELSDFGRDVAIDAADVRAWGNGQRYIPGRSGTATRTQRGGIAPRSARVEPATSTAKAGPLPVCTVTGMPLPWQVETAKRQESNFVAPLLDARGLRPQTCAMHKVRQLPRLRRVRRTRRGASRTTVRTKKGTRTKYESATIRGALTTCASMRQRHRRPHTALLDFSRAPTGEEDNRRAQHQHRREHHVRSRAAGAGAGPGRLQQQAAGPVGGGGAKEHGTGEGPARLGDRRCDHHRAAQAASSSGGGTRRCQTPLWLGRQTRNRPDVARPAQQPFIRQRTGREDERDQNREARDCLLKRQRCAARDTSRRQHPTLRSSHSGRGRTDREPNELPRKSHRSGTVCSYTFHLSRRC